MPTSEPYVRSLEIRAGKLQGIEFVCADLQISIDIYSLLYVDHTSLYILILLMFAD
jgi:hypothetical protein